MTNSETTQITDLEVWPQDQLQHVHTSINSEKQAQSACPNCGDLNPQGNTSQKYLATNPLTDSGTPLCAVGTCNLVEVYPDRLDRLRTSRF